MIQYLKKGMAAILIGAVLFAILPLNCYAHVVIGPPRKTCIVEVEIFGGPTKIEYKPPGVLKDKAVEEASQTKTLRNIIMKINIIYFIIVSFFVAVLLALRNLKNRLKTSNPDL